VDGMGGMEDGWREEDCHSAQYQIPQHHSDDALWAQHCSLRASPPFASDARMASRVRCDHGPVSAGCCGCDRGVVSSRVGACRIGVRADLWIGD
jgi:hypothetical protein